MNDRHGPSDTIQEATLNMADFRQSDLVLEKHGWQRSGWHPSYCVVRCRCLIQALFHSDDGDITHIEPHTAARAESIMADKHDELYMNAASDVGPVTAVPLSGRIE